MNAARLGSILDQLPLAGLPPRALEIGCGAYPAAGALAAVWPGWSYLGLDHDGAALRTARKNGGQRKPPLLIQADARTLSRLLCTEFGLILVRHPDIFLRRRVWSAILMSAPKLLVPGGVLLITLYAPEEVEIVDALPLPPEVVLNVGSLAPADLAGDDRFVRVYRA